MPTLVMERKDLDPDETHEYDVGTRIRVDGEWGEIVSRDYGYRTASPVYGYSIGDEDRRAVKESEIDDVDR